MAFPSNDFPFSLASRTSLGEQVVVPSSQIDSSLNSTLASALSAGYNVVGIFSTCTMTVGTGDLLLYHNVEFFSQIEIFEFQEYFDFEFGSFHGVYVHLMVKVGIVHFLFTDAIVKVLFGWLVKCFIG